MTRIATKDRCPYRTLFVWISIWWVDIRLSGQLRRCKEALIIIIKAFQLIVFARYLLGVPKP